MVLLWTVACTTPTPPADRPDVQARRLELTTGDGVGLVADLYDAPAQAPSVVLLHMTPVGGATRADWPVVFIDALTARGWRVLALDRRGAGESGGEGTDAFIGPGGRLDVEAAVGALIAEQTGPFAILGASNGSTSALDYTVWATAEGMPIPAALGFLTGGSYTEAQNPMTLLEVPSVFTYSTAERAWSVAQMGPPEREFLEYGAGAHGTGMFEAAPEVTPDLVDFLVGVL